MKRLLLKAVGLGLVVVVLAGGIGWWLVRQVEPLQPGDKQRISYTVGAGETLREIADNLQRQGVIRNALGLRVVARLYQPQVSVQMGAHQVGAGLNAWQILDALRELPEQVTITILPGWRREEIAEYLKGVTALEEFEAEEFLRLTAEKEGRLAAETYKIAPLSTTSKIVSVLEEQFVKEVEENQELQGQIRASGRSFEEILILASLLQREARNLEQMRMIAGILESRLADNYPLQLCATAQYAVGKKSSGRWWDPPTTEDTKVNSPYNTYVNSGLPPGPISSVSLAALEAAATPIENDYYFYLHDDAGEIHYGVTLEDHEANIARYLN